MAKDEIFGDDGVGSQADVRSGKKVTNVIATGAQLKKLGARPGDITKNWWPKSGGKPIPVGQMTNYELALVRVKGRSSKVKIDANGDVYAGRKKVTGGITPPSKWGRKRR